MGAALATEPCPSCLLCRTVCVRRIPFRLVCFPAVYLDMTRLNMKVRKTNKPPGPESHEPDETNLH